MEQGVMTTKKWQRLSKRVMFIGFAFAMVVCIVMFIVLGVSINNKSKNTVNTTGEAFMEDIGRQSAMRYDEVIERRLDMVDDLRKTWVEGQSDLDAVAVGMGGAAKTRGFTYLAYLKPDGTFEKLYYAEADQPTTDVSVQGLKLADRTSFVSDLLDGKNKVAAAEGVDKSNPDDPSAKVVDGGVMLFGVPVAGRTDYAAIVAGIKNDDIVKMLSDSDTDGSHIIRIDGSFVMYGGAEGQTSQPVNYKEFLRNGIKVGNAESLWASLESDMQRMSQTTDAKPFSKSISVSNSRKHVYCQKLGNSEWYLVTVTDYSGLDTRIDGLDKNVTTAIAVSCVITALLISGLFIIYFLMNRTNLKYVEEARVSAEEANKAKSDFLSNMSHDIRTPMNAIMGMTTIAIANIDNDQQVADCLKKISLSSRHLLGLINDVLDMSKIESGKMTLNMEQLSLSEVFEGVTSIIQPQMKGKQQKFNAYVRDIVTEDVYCDSVRLNQVLLNLLSNAYKFTPEEGSIELSIYQEESPRGEDYVRTHIEVQDNGIGMSEEFQKQLFDSFTREDRARVNKAEGTGLGMAITKYIIDAMQGSIDVHSKQGEGTKFHVVLDLQKADVPETDMTLPEWKVLVVDGSQTLCDTAVAMLGSLGLKAEAAPDGETAVKMAIKAHEENGGYDIVLTGWKLPGIDGIETAKKLRKKLENLNILLISAYDCTEVEEEARAAGIGGFISKPLFKSTLFSGLSLFAASVDEESGDREYYNKKNLRLKGKRILVAEDNDLNWEIADVLLTSEGLIVEHAENGQTCVDMLLAHKVGYYDAILMDVRMPVMSGLEATTVIRNLKRGYNKVPIIAMTADAFVEDIQKCLACGMNAHIAKPIDIEVVKATLAKYIKK